MIKALILWRYRHKFSRPDCIYSNEISEHKGQINSPNDDMWTDNQFNFTVTIFSMLVLKKKKKN